MISDRFRTAVVAGDVAGASRLSQEDTVFCSRVVYRRRQVGRIDKLARLGLAEPLDELVP
jgi:hypothetical protein